MAFGRDDIDFTEDARKATRHPCFRVENVDKLRELQVRVWGHFLEGKGEKVDGEGGTREERRLGAPVECDEPGKENSGEFGFFPSTFEVS